MRTIGPQLDPSRMSLKDMRILKMRARGMTREQIARKLGYNDLESGTQRVNDTLSRFGDPKEKKDHATP